MAVDGTWGFVYAGETGIGVGAIVVKDGKFGGADAGGIKYRGTVVEDPETGDLAVELEMDVPAGVWLVGGAGAMDMPHTRHQTFKLPPRFGDVAPVEIPIRPGKVLGMFKLCTPEEAAALARGIDIRLKVG
jgi:hypothetical protein